MIAPASDIAFTAPVKTEQTRHACREPYARRETGGGSRTEITPDLIASLAGIGTAFPATASTSGQPYAQLFQFAAWDTNYPRHMPRKVDLADADAMRSRRDGRIRKFETQSAETRSHRPPASAAVKGVSA